MAVRHLLSRVLLHGARRLSSTRLLALACRFAGNDPVSNAAVVYIGARDFDLNSNALSIAVKAALQGSLSGGALVTPFVSIDADAHKSGDSTDSSAVESQRERCLAIIASISLFSRQLDETQSGCPEAKRQIVCALEYAKNMLEGRFCNAYELWIASQETRRVLANLDRLPEQCTASLLESIRADETLAVVLPGMATDSDLSNIKKHNWVGSNRLDASNGQQDDGRLNADLVFLNQFRFKELCNLKPYGHSSQFLVKKSAKKFKRRLSPLLRNSVLFELPEPRTPFAHSPFFAVSIALWTIATFQKPATFFCGDFYLGDRTYHDAQYDKGVSAINEVRHAYLAHDVFFTHAALSAWYRSGKIRAHGSLESLLQLEGIEFAKKMEERWGSESR